MSTAQLLSNRQAFEFFESVLIGLAPDTILKYRRTLSEFKNFLSLHRLRISNLSDTIVADWTVALLAQGLAPSTIARHLNILGSLLGTAAKKQLISPCEAPARLAKLLRTPSQFPPLLDPKVSNRLLKFLKEDKRNSDTFAQTCEDMLRYSILNGALSLSALTTLRKSDIRCPDAPALDPYSSAIIRRNETPTRAYVFAFNQTQRTPNQLARDIYGALQPLLLRLGIISPADEDSARVPDIDAIVSSLWAALAMRAGATASEALGCLNQPAPYAIPDFCEPITVQPDTAGEWRQSVARLLRRDQPHWYAMQLRRGVKFDELRKEIAEKIRPLPELFYPCETITRIVRNKKVVLDQPVISRTAFFRSAPDSVLPLFREIGDKAWCYRVHNNPLAPYAIIPTREMRRFQAAVGIFTPDIEVHPLGTLTPQPGEQVIIIAAGYQGRPATVEEITRDPQGIPVLIRVLLTTDQGYEWRLHLTPAQLQRLEETSN